MLRIIAQTRGFTQGKLGQEQIDESFPPLLQGHLLRTEPMKYVRNLSANWPVKKSTQGRLLAIRLHAILVLAHISSRDADASRISCHLGRA
eukprot:scaffold670423_cov69-Prasinocladus_malaysianus.AAC.1